MLGPQNDPRGSGAQRIGGESTASTEGIANVTSVERALAGKAKLPTNNRQEVGVDCISITILVPGSILL